LSNFSIILVRHGPVALRAPGLLSRDVFLRYVAAYEAAGLRPDARPPDVLSEKLNACSEIFASDAPRVAKSIKLLGLRREAIVDPLFGEELHSVPNLSGRWPLIVWFALSRGNGLFHPRQDAARRKLRERAILAAGRLIRAAEQGPAALIGHGWFNHAVGASLKTRGWRRSGGAGGSAPWGLVVFERENGR
jgi:hypothetical protein